MTDSFPQIVVLHTKGGDIYYDASTPERWAKSCLAIIRYQDELGCYFLEDDDFSPVNITDIPSPYKEQAERDNERKIADARRVNSANSVVRALKECLATEDTSLVPSRSRRNHFDEEPRAWRLLESRQDYEYEYVELSAVRSIQ